MGTNLFLLIAVLAICVSSAHAFGAGNIPSHSYLEGRAFRHGDIEDILEELFKKAGAGAGILGAIGMGNKFKGLDIKRIYFGNWLRDYSQAFDVAGLSKLSAQTILNLIMVLGFLAHGYATGEFEVTEERIGVYQTVEHLDNPLGYAADLPGGDARAVHPKLRPPVLPCETEVDPRTGMKNYLANEQDGRFDTGAGFIRRTMHACIDMGRRARQSGNDKDMYEAYRLLGQFLHSLEDLPAHSNWVELALIKMGHRDVFTHVGDRVKVNSPRHGAVPPLVTGTFGGSDFIHSLLGEASDHISEASVSDLQKQFDKARSAPRGMDDNLRDLFFQLPGGQGQQLSREMDQVSQQSRAIDPSQMSPQELHANLWRILSFRDKVCMSIERGIERVPGLGSLIDRITDSINRFVFTTIEPWIKPLMGSATATLSQGSAAVVNNSDQFAVFDNPNASDPTHSMLSKDHFSQILNEPAGKVAIIIVKHAVKDVVQAWDNPSLDPHQVINNTLMAIHHPFFADGRSPVQNEMYQCVERWFNEQDDKRYVLNGLTKESVRNHRNNRKGTKPDPHHQPNNSFLPTPQQVGGAAQAKISGVTNQVFQHMPGYSTYQNVMSREGPGGGPSDNFQQGGQFHQGGQFQPSFPEPSQFNNSGYQEHNNFQPPPPGPPGDFYGQGSSQMPMPMPMPGGSGFDSFGAPPQQPYPGAPQSSHGHGGHAQDFYGAPQQQPPSQGYNPNYQNY